MKHYLIIQLLFLCTIAPAMAQYYSVNYDTRTVAEMSAAFGTEAATEAYYAQQIAKIREHYQARKWLLLESSVPSSSTAELSQIWDFGPVQQRTTITAVYTTWCLPKLCPKYGQLPA